MKIFAADLWPGVLGTQTYAQAADQEMVRGKVRLRQLAENVLLYDQVYLPTDNFVALSFLTTAFGVDAITALIDEDILKFTRFIGQMGYAGGGGGLVTMSLAVEETLKNKGAISHAWMPTGVVAAAILHDMHGLETLAAKRVAAKVIHATKEVELKTLLPEVRVRASATVLSETAGSDFRISNTDINRLGVAPNQVRLLGDIEKPDLTEDVGKFMLAARTHLEVVASEHFKCDDLSTLSPIGRVLADQHKTETALHQLYEITDVPDLGAQAMAGTITIQQIVKMRNTKNWQEFRKWFHESCDSEPERVGREYVKLLRAEAPQDSMLLKTLRLLITSGLGCLGPLAGVAASAVDTYLVPRFKAKSAKYFVEELEQLAPSQIKGAE